MTADRVVHQCGAARVESAELRERNFGDLRGTPYDQLGDIDIFAPNYAPPNGESWPVFHQRVDRAWSLITRHADKAAGDLCVITHGLVLRSLFERRLDLGDITLEEELVVHNTAITEVTSAAPWQVLRLAEIPHLDGDVHDVAPV